MRVLAILKLAVTALGLSSTLVAGYVIEERARGGKPNKWALSAKPKPGVSGVHTHQGKTYIHYGDQVEQHASHVSYHNNVYPEHKNAAFKSVISTSEKTANRKAALAKIKTTSGQVRDEKPLASTSHGAKKTTVMSVPDAESRLEGQLAAEAKRQAGGRNGIVLVDNRSKNRGDPTPLGKLLKVKRGLISDFGKFFKIIEADFKEAGEDIITAVKQIDGSLDHQLGGFYKGFHCFDFVDDYNQQHNVTVSEENMAFDQAAINVYTAAWHEVTALLGKSETTDLGADIDNTTDGEFTDDDPSDASDEGNN